MFSRMGFSLSDGSIPPLPLEFKIEANFELMSPAVFKGGSIVPQLNSIAVSDSEFRPGRLL